MYRPEITVVDCTIRDAGLMNNSRFPDETVSAVYRAICAAGIQVVELGYRNSKKMFSPDDYGPWRFCDEDALKRVTEDVETQTKISVMMDSHKAEAEDLLPKEQSVVDMVRIATYVKDVDKAILLANDADQKGYETTINVMAISHALDRELDEAIDQIGRETNVAACYIVDSFGALYSEDIDYYVAKYRKHLGKGKEIGIHCHNQQQLAFANTIEGIIKGANYLDGTLLGTGRAAGNCPLELLIGFLKNPKFHIRPVLDVIGKYILPLQKEMVWGYHVPYMISGMLNVHPQESMDFMEKDPADPTRQDFVKFYDKVLESIR